ncbi:MAG: peptidase C11 [Clostridia bacterium]|nr:peptidase C11 [Clostridia bacterium]
MADDRPSGRQRNVSGTGNGVYRRGSGTGSGPVGNSGGYSGRGGSSGNSGRNNGSSGGNRNTDGNRGIFNLGGGGGSGLTSLLGNKKVLIIIAIIVVLALIFGGTGMFKKLGNLCSGTNLLSSLLPTNSDTSYVTELANTNTSTGWDRTSNSGKALNTSVASGSRAKYTTILGNGNDQVTIMMYMCGTDLESKNGMASSDLAEMAKATLADKLNIIVMTGGCTGWKTTAISNTTNQVYKIANGGIIRLESDFGNTSMTNPDTLTKFINYCKNNFSANRYELIFWDHGGGSISGYGYDQRFPSSGGMTLAKINTALKNAGIQYDFIGFDTCLMATTENALMLSSYADYLIASEETEPGAGWYYTNWLTKFAANTSMSTIEVGKMIIDDFTDFCASKYSNAKTTLSIVDLAELQTTVPSVLSDFARTTTNLIKSDNYSDVSEARGNTREYSTSKIDQVDLVNLADNIGTKEGKALANAILSAVKYNRTSASMTNSYGLSIYFPYSKLGNVDSAVTTYGQIGMNSEYTQCIKSFASMETAGQVVSGGSSSPVSSILGNFSQSSNSGSSSDAISSLLGSFLGGSSGVSIDGLDSGNLSFLDSLIPREAAGVLAGNIFDASKIQEWIPYKNTKVIGLEDDQWKLVQSLELNVFYDDGKGYIDLGLDNIFEFKDGYLVGEYDGAWLAINNQVVPYYYMETVKNGSNTIIRGRVPALINEKRAELLICFVNNDPGVVEGIRYIYEDNETGTVAKDADLGTFEYDFNVYDSTGAVTSSEKGSVVALQNGDVIEFLCDYYSYAGVYQDSFRFGDKLIYNGSLEVTDVLLPDASKANAVYRFVDIYGQQYFSAVIE